MRKYCDIPKMFAAWTMTRGAIPLSMLLWDPFTIFMSSMTNQSQSGGGYVVNLVNGASVDIGGIGFRHWRYWLEPKCTIDIVVKCTIDKNCLF